MKKSTLYISGLALLLGLLMLTSPTFARVPPLHETWDQLLKKHVKDGWVDYKGFNRDVKQLDYYLDQLAKLDVSRLSGDEKLAYWVNAYNAFTVKLILNHYPIPGIRKISRPWKRKEWKASGKMVSLDHIEHEILRKNFKEPRIHFAIVCASIGCPDLQPFAFYAAKIEEQLTHAAKHFFNSTKHFELKQKGDYVTIHISKIFSWFGKDFGGDKRTRANFMLPYLDEKIALEIKKAGKLKFKYKSYDWNLNEKQ